MMRHYLRTRAVVLFAFFLLFVFSAPLYAQKQSGKSCLFKVTSSGGTVYLLGYVPLMKESMYPLSGTIERAFQRSSNVVFEANDESPANTRKMIAHKSIFTDGNTLGKVLKPATYERLKEAVKPLGLNVVQLEMLKPWSVAISIVELKLNQLGFRPGEQGVEQYFYKKAVDMGKKISYLETVEWEIGFLSGLPMAQQEAFLNQSLDDDFSDVDEVMAAWESGDIKKIEQMISDSLQAYPELYDTLFVYRNKRLVFHVDALLAQKKASFVIVKVGHLVGQGNLLELLRRKGYVVEQM